MAANHAASQTLKQSEVERWHREPCGHRLDHGCFVDSNRNTLLLCEGTDSAYVVAGQPFGVGGTHHLCSLAVECGSQFFMLTSRSDGTMTQTDVPSTSTIRVFSTRRGSTLMASDNNSYCGHLEMKD
jgi:hypothetical protein